MAGLRSVHVGIASTGLSIALHGGLGVTVTALLALRKPPDPKLCSMPPAGGSPPVLEQPEPDPAVRLGVEDSSSTAIAWVGFAEATEHAVPEGVTDQSALAPEPGIPVPQPETQPPEPPSLTTETPINDVLVDPSTDPLAPPERPADAAPAPAPAAPEPAVIVETELALESPRVIPEQPAPIPLAHRPVAPPEPLAPAESPVPPQPTRPPHSAPSAPAPAPASGRPAIASDEDSEAFSTNRTLEYRSGKVQAGKGLDIKVVRRPIFSKYIRVTAIPRNPTVHISFDASGKVRKAVIARSSGYTDIDEPILDALHTWTARGQEIRDLSSRPAGSTLKVPITIVLR